MNWASAITDLEKHGWSLTGIGKAIGLSPQAVSDIKHGRTKSPGGMAAVRLLKLHECGKPPHDMPPAPVVPADSLTQPEAAHGFGPAPAQQGGAA